MGKDEEFRDWYKNVHIPELLQVPGFIKGTRYHSESPEVKAPYMTVYEIESSDIEVTMGKMQELSKDMTRSDEIDEESVSLQIYHQSRKISLLRMAAWKWVG